MITRRKFLPILTLLAGFGLLLPGGCGRGSAPSGVAFSDVAAMTEQVLTDLLLGLPPHIADTLPARPDPALLKKGVYEHVFLATDGKGFAGASRGEIAEADIQALEKRVVEGVDKTLKASGFSAERIGYPVTAPDRSRSLVVTLTPTTQESGSPQERAERRNKTFVLIRLTVTDPATGSVLAQRDFYSGRDVRQRARARREDR